MKVDANAAKHALKVLAVLTDEDTARAVLDSAAAARGIDPEGRILALHIRVDPQMLITSPEETAVQFLQEAREGSARVRSERIHWVFDDWANSHGSELGPENLTGQ